jgi:N-acetylmuramic acid 6-phosphate (MurNAc-6-P) etherase
MQRGIGIVSQLTGLDDAEATRLLHKTTGSVPVAVLMQKAGLTRAQAERCMGPMPEAECDRRWGRSIPVVDRIRGRYTP